MPKKARAAVILGTALILCVIATIVSLFHYDISGRGISGGENIVYDESILSYDSNWYLLTEEGKEPAAVPGVVSQSRGRELTISNTLPASVTEGTYLAFMGSDCFVTVYIGDEEVYRSPVMNNRGKLTPLPGWVFVPLKGAYSTEEIALSFYYPYSGGTVPRILLGTHPEILLYASYSTYSLLYIGISVLVLGIVVFIFSLVTFTGSAPRPGYVFLGIYIAALGFVLINRAGIPRTETYMYYVEYMVSGLVIRILPMIHSLYMYLRDMKKTGKLFRAIFILSFAFFAISLGLHFFGIWDLTASVGIAQVIMIAELCASLFAELKEAGDVPRACRLLTAAGIGALVLGLLADTLMPYIFKDYTYDLRYAGSLVFAMLETAAVAFTAYSRSLEGLKLSNELTKDRMQLMISQIQPHFIYNTLNAIRAMIKREPDKAYDTIYDFAGYLRYNINALSSIELIPFSEELKHIKVYTDIEQERFRERVSIVYEIGNRDFALPPLSVQPFVENAVKHGVCKKAEGGTVTIRSYAVKNADVVEIEDTGVGFDTSILSEEGKRGIGIRNTVYRLKELAGAEVTIDSRLGEGTLVRIEIPRERRASAE